jgi:hypothetical protein
MKFELTGGYAKLVQQSKVLCQKVKIPPTVNGCTVVAIADDVFKNNTCLVEIEIPNSVKEIGNRAFQNCLALQSVIFYPSSQTTQLCILQNDVFSGCTRLKKIHFTGKIKINGNNNFAKCKQLEIVDGIFNSLLAGTFYGCEKLDDLVFYGKSYIVPSAFQYCHSLKHITFKDDLSPKTPEKTIELLKQMHIKCCANSVFVDWAYDGVDVEIMEAEHAFYDDSIWY